MDTCNWLVMEMLAKQAADPLRQVTPRPPERPNGHRGVKHSLASTLVRLGLRLDPAAGEGLGGRPLARAGR